MLKDQTMLKSTPGPFFHQNVRCLIVGQSFVLARYRPRAGITSRPWESIQEGNSTRDRPWSIPSQNGAVLEVLEMCHSSVDSFRSCHNCESSSPDRHIANE